MYDESRWIRIRFGLVVFSILSIGLAHGSLAQDKPGVAEGRKAEDARPAKSSWRLLGDISRRGWLDVGKDKRLEIVVGKQVWIRSASGAFASVTGEKHEGGAFSTHSFVPGRVTTEEPKRNDASKASPYLLVTIGLEGPVVEPGKNDAPRVRRLPEFHVNDAAGKAVGEFVGLYNVSAEEKVLVFAGQWESVEKLVLKASDDRVEGLVGEGIAAPYLALSLDDTQRRKVKDVCTLYEKRIAALDNKITAANEKQEPRLEESRKKLLEERDRVVERLLGEEQKTKLAALRKP